MIGAGTSGTFWPGGSIQPGSLFRLSFQLKGQTTAEMGLGEDSILFNWEAAVVIYACCLEGSYDQ